MTDHTPPNQNPSDDANQMAPFDASLPHHQRPKLRPVRGFGTQAQGPDGKPMPVLGLADSKQISDKIVFTQPAMQAVLPLLNGEHAVEEVVSKVGHGLTNQMLEDLVRQLDHAALIEGPNFESLWDKMRADFDSTDDLPPGQTVAIAEQMVVQQAANNAGRAAIAANPEDQQAAQQAAQEAAQAVTDEDKSSLAPAALRHAIDSWMNQTMEQVEDPSFDTLPKAVLVPFTMYSQGWMNYAHIYGRLRVVDRPDRVVILGVNHFGTGTGAVGCDKGFRTPLGTCPADSAFADDMRKRLGDKLFEHRFDHEREHSIELQIPWLQVVFGGAENDAAPLPVFAALLHDPVVKDGKSYDGQGVDLNDFSDALQGAIEAAPGRTLVIASHELSHVGAAFGDQQPFGAQSDEGEKARAGIIQQDQSLMKMYAEGKHKDMILSLNWQQNPTRWNSTGVLVAAWKAVGGLSEGKDLKIHHFAGAVDPAGNAMVTSVAASIC